MCGVNDGHTGQLSNSRGTDRLVITASPSDLSKEAKRS